MAEASMAHVHEVAAALERADASARVLGARARAARDGAGPTAAFTALASVGPDGLVPGVGTGGALAARHLEHAALAASAAGPLIPSELTETVAYAAASVGAHAGGANALDPVGVARFVRREVAAVRGIAAHAMRRDVAWEVMRLGTFLPRAAWMSALLLSCARVAAASPDTADSVWMAASGVAGARGDDAPPPDRVALVLITDNRAPVAVAYAVEEVTGALFALTRSGGTHSPALALSRATAARLANASLHERFIDDPALAVGEVLDAIGSLAAAAIPAALNIPGGQTVSAGPHISSIAAMT